MHTIDANKSEVECVEKNAYIFDVTRVTKDNTRVEEDMLPLL